MNATQEHMLTLAKHAQANAYAPYSQFKVGVCIRSQGGLFFAGTNVENCAYPTTQCAEGAAVGAMITAGERVITDVLIVSPNPMPCPPCGNCRQMIAEFADPAGQIHLVNCDGELLEVIATAGMLPHQFTFEPKK